MKTDHKIIIRDSQMSSSLVGKLRKVRGSSGLLKNRFGTGIQKEIPKRAKDKKTVKEVEEVLQKIPTSHKLFLGDSRDLGFIKGDVHLVVTSPPYWTIKDYRVQEGQLGVIKDYKEFHSELNKVWKACFDLLVPGGRLVVVVGDACLSRRKNGRHEVVPLHSDIQINCRKIGFENLAPIIWYKITNVSLEAKGGRYLGKPYEPNAIIKNDIEYILFLRKPGYRSPSDEKKKLSVIPEERQREWFQQIWRLTGASTVDHPAPFPVNLAERLVRMFSFVDDVVLDPFMGTGSTNIAAMKWGRNSIGVELNRKFFNYAKRRIRAEAKRRPTKIEIEAENYLK